MDGHDSRQPASESNSAVTIAAYIIISITALAVIFGIIYTLDKISAEKNYRAALEKCSKQDIQSSVSTAPANTSSTEQAPAPAPTHNTTATDSGYTISDSAAKAGVGQKLLGSADPTTQCTVPNK